MLAMDTAVFAPDSFRDSSNEPERKAKSSKFWAMSLLLHSILLVLVVLFHSTPVPPTGNPAKAVNARLVYPIQSIPHTESAAKQEKSSTRGAPLSPQTVPSITEYTLNQKQSFERIRKSTVPVSNQGPAPLQAKARLNLSPATALKKLQSTEQRALVNQATQQRRRLITSPEIIDPRRFKEDIPIIIQTHKINCDNGVNGVIGLISGIAGGTLECSDRGNNINTFIDKHKK